MRATNRHWLSLRRLRQLVSLALVALAAVGCSDTGTGNTNNPVGSDAADADGTAEVLSDGQVGDATAQEDATGADTASGDAADAAQADATSLDSLADASDAGATDTATEEDVDWSELLDPQDTGTPPSDVAEPAGPVGQLYAETPDQLYRLDLASQSFVLVGKFTFDKNGGNVTDIALDQGGKLYAITNDDLFVCEPKTAGCKWLAAFPANMSIFNGLTFVPKGTVEAANEALIGISQAGEWTHVQFAGGKVTLKQLGTYGGKWLSSGDSFSVEGIGTYATLKTSSSTSDTLASIDPASGKILKIIGDTGVKGLFGLAWWSGVFYAFSSDGNAYTLDIATGKATLAANIASPKGIKWWGAGVSTRANGKP